jgi:DNA-binding CsgD family transcriptional regulator
MRRIPTLRSGLTAREAQVLGLMCEGFNNVQVASHLGIDYKTVRWHVSNVLDKLGAKSRHQAVAIAFAKGLVRP